jgi:hypothetical protein
MRAVKPEDVRAIASAGNWVNLAVDLGKATSAIPFSYTLALPCVEIYK